jgi:hypothetical protein
MGAELVTRFFYMPYTITDVAPKSDVRVVLSQRYQRSSIALNWLIYGMDAGVDWPGLSFPMHVP